MSVRTDQPLKEPCWRSADSAQLRYSLAAVGWAAFLRIAARWPQAMKGCPSATAKRVAAVEGAASEPDPPTPMAFFLPLTATPGVCEPRLNCGCWAANCAIQSQP